MAENTSIEWADHTWNPWEGCQKVGPGCDHCYAETRNARYNRGLAPNWGPGAPRRKTSVANWRKPLKWAREAEAFKMKHGRRQRVFCASLADVFDNAVDPEWRRELFDLIDHTPELDWLLLTKRIGNVKPMLEAMGRHYLSDHIWIGATIVNQVEADRDIPKLLAIEARVRFLSMEPLLGRVDLLAFFDPTGACCGGEPEYHCKNCPSDAPWRYSEPSSDGEWAFDPQIHWVIVGGESGLRGRPMHPAWVDDLRQQCEEAEVPFLFKQWGEWAPYAPKWPAEHIRHVGMNGVMALHPGPASEAMIRLDKKHSGRELDGRTYTQFPK